MVIKFHNGYTVTVTDCKETDRKKIINEAKQAVSAVVKAKDAELTKVITTNVSFQPTKLEAAYKENNENAKNREIGYLMRDIEADLTHDNYPRAYTTKVLLGIIDKYLEAEKIARKYKDEKLADTILEKVAELKTLWNLEVAKTADSIDEDGNELPGRFSVEYDVWDNRINEYAKLEKLFFGEAYDDDEAESKFNAFIKNKLKPGQSIKRRVIRWYDSKNVKDVPYYDPSDSPRIKSNYSPDRVSKEIAHSSEKGAMLDELQDVFDEIDEFIGRGREVLVNAGWSRDDARHAINERYYTFVRELEDVGKAALAKTLRERIGQLEKVWDLKR